VSLLFLFLLKERYCLSILLVEKSKKYLILIFFELETKESKKKKKKKMKDSNWKIDI